MNKERQELVTLNELSKRLGVNKSKLNYYAWRKLITPHQTIGKTMVFKEDEVIKKLKKIEKYQKEEKTLKEISNLLEKK